MTIPILDTIFFMYNIQWCTSGLLANLKQTRDVLTPESGCFLMHFVIAEAYGNQ